MKCGSEHGECLGTIAWRPFYVDISTCNQVIKKIIQLHWALTANVVLEQSSIHKLITSYLTTRTVWRTVWRKFGVLFSLKSDCLLFFLLLTMYKALRTCYTCTCMLVLCQDIGYVSLVGQYCNSIVVSRAFSLTQRYLLSLCLACCDWVSDADIFVADWLNS